MINSLRRILQDFYQDTSGQFVVIAALAMLPILTSAGIAVDYTHQLLLRSNLQNALDSAALATAAAHEKPDAERKAIGNDVFLSNSDNPCMNDSDILIVGNTVTATASCKLKTSFLGIIGMPELDVYAKAGAVIEPDTGSAMCVIALHPADKNTLLASGGSNLNANKCTVQVNSENTEAVTLSGGSKGSVAQIS